MHLYIWKRAVGVTAHEHTEAGVVIIGLNLPNARHLFRHWQAANQRPNDACEIFHVAPDLVIPIAPRDHEVLVFPDKGCCG